jgi:hypothetical protein
MLHGLPRSTSFALAAPNAAVTSSRGTYYLPDAQEVIAALWTGKIAELFGAGRPAVKVQSPPRLLPLARVGRQLLEHLGRAAPAVALLAAAGGIYAVGHFIGWGLVIFGGILAGLLGLSRL